MSDLEKYMFKILLMLFAARCAQENESMSDVIKKGQSYVIKIEELVKNSQLQGPDNVLSNDRH